MIQTHSVIEEATPLRLGPMVSGLSETAKWIDFHAPASGNVIARIRDCGVDDVEACVAIARRAFAQHRRVSRYIRIGWLQSAANAMSEQSDELAAMVSEDVGKPIRVARFEASRGAGFLRATAAAAAELGSEVLPLDALAAGAGTVGMTRRVPFGVIAGIIPFNAPINLLLQKVAPAIAMGNAIVVKPALSGTRVALALSKIMIESGLPEGLLTVLTGDKDTALGLAAHSDVDAVTFTGGTEAGNSLVRAAGAKKFLAELGSNSANIVMADASLNRTAEKIALAAFEASGQQCVSAQRVLVESTVCEAFSAKLVEAAQRLRVGPADDPMTDLGPMVHIGAAKRVMAMVEDAVSRGARVLLQPRLDGATVSPGILTNVPRDARLWREEVFGPIVVVAPFENVAEATEMANDTPFGLQGAVFTNDLNATLRFADDLDVGSLWINEPSRFRLDTCPFGGVKQSGIGREGVRYALEELSQIKFIGIRSTEEGVN